MFKRLQTSRNLSLILLLMLVSPILSAAQNPQPAYKFINGQWFDGQRFAGREFYSVNGVLTSKKPKWVDSVIDLKGGYVIPPFGEAHNHNSESEKIIPTYLNDGIFYVKNPNNLPRSRTALEGKINIPLSIDVVFANGGLTSTGGHPIGIARRNISRKIYTEADSDGGFYFTVDNEVDLERKWNAIIAGKPDFIKTFLLYSEEYGKRKTDEKYFGWKGLDPALLPKIVQKAHATGLRVSTHIETATDFNNALVAGVDEISHLPGFRGNPNLDVKIYEITETDAKLAAKNGTFVVTTLGGIRGLDKNHPIRQKAEALFAANLGMLKKHNVRIVIGSDSYEETSAPEALYISSLGVFDNLGMLKMWCETTAQAIFPKRRIGRLINGYEASFLVLANDPLKDFRNTQKIEIRVKQGMILTVKQD